MQFHTKYLLSIAVGVVAGTLACAAMRVLIGI